MSRAIKASVWRMPKRVEACGCTECPIDSKWGCSSTQTIFNAWPGWFVFNWLPRRALCALIGHRINKWHGPHQCDRCLSKKITAEIDEFGNARVAKR